MGWLRSTPPVAPAPAAPAPAARFLGDLARIQVQEGDVCVLMSPRQISADEAQKLKSQWQVVFGEGVTLLVLDGGMRLGVLSPTAAAEATSAIEDAKLIAQALGGS